MKNKMLRATAVILAMLLLIAGLTACKAKGDNGEATQGDDTSAPKAELNSKELASYGQKCTVTIRIGENALGSGFFIDGEGTVVTVFHVLEGALQELNESGSTSTRIYVDVMGHGNIPVETVVSWNPVYDLAVLKLDYASENFLTFADEEPSVGESVMAVGSALGDLGGTCTSGNISSEKRKVGLIECLQTDAAISGGNSGGPLLNVYGEVVGINSFSYASGQNLNLAIKPSMMEHLGEELNYTVNQMSNWYGKEVERSYTGSGSNQAQTLINQYDVVTNKYDGTTVIKCKGSSDSTFAACAVSGYNDAYQYYYYDYDVSSYDAYVDYLYANNFEESNRVSKENTADDAEPNTYDIVYFTHNGSGDQTYVIELGIDVVNDIVRVQFN